MATCRTDSTLIIPLKLAGCVFVTVISRPDWEREMKLGAVSTGMGGVGGGVTLECAAMQ